MRRLAGLAGVALLLAMADTRAADPPGSKVTAHRSTLVGELVITQLGDDWAAGPFRITLGDRLVMSTDNDKPVEGMPIPSILASFRGDVPPYDEIVVLQQSTAGNACNGGPIWFLGIHKSGEFHITEPIDFCGGPSPVIKRDRRGIVLTFPGGPPNHGTGWLPTAVWVFRGGEAKQIE
jgi:hypothetical protein